MVDIRKEVEDVVEFVRDAILFVLEGHNMYSLNEILGDALDTEMNSLSTMECAEIVIKFGEDNITDRGIIDNSSFVSYAMTGAYACLETLALQDDEISFLMQYSDETLRGSNLEEVLEILDGLHLLEDED